MLKEGHYLGIQVGGVLGLAGWGCSLANHCGLPAPLCQPGCKAASALLPVTRKGHVASLYSLGNQFVIHNLLISEKNNHAALLNSLTS